MSVVFVFGYLLSVNCVMPFCVVASSVDPEGGTRGPDPLENHKLYGFQQGISNWIPPPEKS